MKVLYEDNHILAVLKPGGIPTQPPPDNSQISIEDIAKEMIRERDQKKGGVFLHAVHRLDKDAYGIVVFAKTQKALSRLMESMRNGLWKKEYIAIVQGKKSPAVGIYQDYIVHGDHKASIVSKNHPQAKKALLEVVDVYPNNLKNRNFSDTERSRFDSEKTSPLLDIGAVFSESKMGCSVKEKTDSSSCLGISSLSQETWQLRIILHTGRYHQIRAQLAERGFSIIGDKKYGSKKEFSRGIALCHVKVVFPHPTLKEDVVLEIAADDCFETEKVS